MQSVGAFLGDLGGPFLAALLRVDLVVEFSLHNLQHQRGYIFLVVDEALLCH